MLADMATALEAARQLVYVAAAKSERDDPDLSFFGTAATCFASDAAMQITTDAAPGAVPATWMTDSSAPG